MCRLVGALLYCEGHGQTVVNNSNIYPQTNNNMSTAELAVSYAALILADDSVDITV